MKILRMAVAFLVVSFPLLLAAQTTPSAKDKAPIGAAAEPVIADVHPSPYRSKMYPSTNISNQRFDMRDATVLDLITTAWDREPTAVLGGPSWIDFNHYDLTVKLDSLRAPKSAPVASTNPGAMSTGNQQADPYEQIRPALKNILTQRFRLGYHTEDKLLPGYVMTVAKGGPKLSEARDPTAETNCHSEPMKDTPGQYAITCTSVSIDKFISMFGGIYPHRVVDKTDLKKSYDFALTMNFNNLRSRDEYVRVYTDALGKLGLVVTAQDVLQPAMVVDRVDETPTPNDPNIAKLILPLPDLEFEVASIKLAAPGDGQGGVRPTGSQITFSSMSLQDLIVQAWALPTGAMISDVESLPKQRYTILVKLPPDIDARAVWQDPDQVNHMMQKMLIDRFQIKYHWGEQTQDAWVLLSTGTPKLKKADPKARTYCKYGPPEGERDMHPENSAYDNQSHCQNVSMDQFTEMLQTLAKSEIKNRVLNKTELGGSYDLTFYYSSTRKLRAQSAAAVAAAKDSGGDAASDPADGMNIQDAFRKELGLKLEKQPRKVPSLILDHYDPTPTEN